MQLVQKLMDAKLEALKTADKETQRVLTYLLSGALTLAKLDLRDLSDSDVVNAAKKIIKQNKDFLTTLAEREKLYQAMDDDYHAVQLANILIEREKLTVENALLTTYLPLQLTEEAIRTKIVNTIKDVADRNKGLLMKYFKSYLAATKQDADMSLVSKIIDDILRSTDV